MAYKWAVGIVQLINCLSTGVTAIKNPILPGWNPDPSILRVGGEYFLATSSFEYFPGTPIYRSSDLVDWELFSHAQTRLNQIQLYGTPTGAGVWAPTLSHINGKFYLASMSRWTYDPVAKVWPRVLWMTSTDLKEWSDPIWGEPWGIDPALFQDPVSKKVYLNLMAPNNNIDRLWGIYQCEVDLSSGNCIGQYRSLWNGTLPHTPDARPEGPKMFKRGQWYYLLIAEGGTDELHRASIARSSSPEGPWVANPDNPLIYNGQYGFGNLTVQSTGHATIFDTPEGSSYAVFLARRNINGSSPLGRETFLCQVDWKIGWPVFNHGNPILLGQDVGPKSTEPSKPKDFVDNFDRPSLHTSWSSLRSPYTSIYTLSSSFGGSLTFQPNVFSLSDRDVPAAILRKQRSLNMTFTADLLPLNGNFSPLQSIGISAYLSELSHYDIGVRGCAHTTGLCVYTSLLMNGTTTVKDHPLQTDSVSGLSLHIRASPLAYRLGYSLQGQRVTWVTEFSSAWLAFAPNDWFVFTGASFALFASGNGNPWPVNGPKVGFTRIVERYFEENIPDHDDWN